MANNFLDKFRSGLKSVQSRQILALLTREKQNGNISTVEEFKKRLTELTSKLANSTIAPTTQLILAEFSSVIDSESFNFMLERIQDDLQAAFQEANDIDEVIEAHEAIVNDVVLKNLELAINDLESKVTSLEFINNSGSGFDVAAFNTFRVTQNNRSSLDQGVIFIDPKSKLQSGPATEAFIDFIGEKLLLGASLIKTKPILSIRQIFDSEAKQSEEIVEFQGSKLGNIIDGKVGSFWSQSILLGKTEGETGLFTKLELNLGVVQTINFLQIEPLLLYPIDIYRLSYIDENNQSQTLLDNPVEITSTQKLFFNTISTKKLQIVFRNRNFSHVQFEIKPDSPSVIVSRTTDPSKLVEAAREDLLDVVGSPVVKNILGLSTTPTQITRKYYEYFMGLDNIEVGSFEFADTSIFISKTEKVDYLGQAALKVLDKRPFTTNDSRIEYTLDTQPSATDTLFHASLEYFLIKRDFSSTGSLVNVLTIPILPLNTAAIRHERLLLTKKSDNLLTTNNIGFLQFYTSDPDIHVYRNGIELDSFDDDMSVIDGWASYATDTNDNPGQPIRMQKALRIQKPSPLDIYTVSYTPDISTSNILPQDLETTSVDIIDLTGNLDSWLGKNNLVYFNPVKNGIKIAYSLVNLAIVLRRNSANATLTPVVEEYLLALSSNDTRKFGDNK